MSEMMVKNKNKKMKAKIKFLGMMAQLATT
jgi:hypothetical protein